MYKVVIVDTFHEAGLQLLRNHPDLLEMSIITDLSAESIAKGVTGAGAITIRNASLPGEILALAPDLKIVSRHGVGVDKIDIAHLSARGIPLAIAADANVDSVAEHTMMMMLAAAKELKAGDRAVRNGDFSWRNRLLASDVMGKTALIMGFGRIGQKVARLCRAFDMRVLAYDPYVKSSPVPQVTMVTDYRAVLPETDFLCLHLPATSETTGMFGKTTLAALKKGAVLINCARGGIVSEDDLEEALANGRLKAACLDVFSPEPPDASHPLLSRDNALLSPHNAALTQECAVRMATQCAQNVIDCLEGKLDPRVVFNRKELGW
jgi:D-3-phosphoglycerate dehydrogenase